MLLITAGEAVATISNISSRIDRFCTGVKACFTVGLKGGMTVWLIPPPPLQPHFKDNKIWKKLPISISELLSYGISAVSLTPLTDIYFRISPRIFVKILNGPHGKLRATGETNWWKNLKSKISRQAPFNHWNSNGKTSIVHYRILSFFALRF